jgi:YD repeat-containing protein
MTNSQHIYEVRPRREKRGVDLISEVLPFGCLWYGEPNAISNAIGYAMFRSRSHRAVIRVYDDAGNVIETHQHAGESSTYTRFGSTLTTSGERNAPRWL